jgi:predicted restriction endonuclease
METTQTALIKKYFEDHPNQDIAHPEIVDWAVEEYKKLTGEVFRDPDRAIRKLSQEGFLIKVRKGVYRYEPDNVSKRVLEDFSESLKKAILERDGYRCVICGRGKSEGVEIHVDHIIPKDGGGRATLANGQTLCSEHNFRKKNYGYTESAKRMFVLWYATAKEANDERMMAFFGDILRVYEKYNINGHIE